MAAIYRAGRNLSKAVRWGRDMTDMVILDAMGVLYEAGDDVAELLVPFVGRHGRADLLAEAIDRDYVEASLGRMDTDAFWRRMGVDPALEDSYLAGHRLIEGTLEALAELKQRHGRLACLSNDVSVCYSNTLTVAAAIGSTNMGGESGGY